MQLFFSPHTQNCATIRRCEQKQRKHTIFKNLKKQLKCCQHCDASRIGTRNRSFGILQTELKYGGMKKLLFFRLCARAARDTQNKTKQCMRRARSIRLETENISFQRHKLRTAKRYLESRSVCLSVRIELNLSFA